MNAPLLGSTVVASVASVIVERAILGNEPLFHVPRYQLIHPAELGAYAALGIAGGGVSLLSAYALLLSRLIAGARSASERPGMLVIMAIATAMVFQIFINVGMALGFLPVIGVPLPLMSAGLSAILSTFIAIGFVVSVKMRRFVN